VGRLPVWPVTESTEEVAGPWGVEAGIDLKFRGPAGGLDGGCRHRRSCRGACESRMLMGGPVRCRWLPVVGVGVIEDKRAFVHLGEV